MNALFFLEGLFGLKAGGAEASKQTLEVANPPGDAARSELTPLEKSCEAQRRSCYAVTFKVPHWAAESAVQKEGDEEGPPLNQTLKMWWQNDLLVFS